MAEQKATNVTWHEHSVSKDERAGLSGHRGAVLWFTGLSACGKSTVANTVDHMLHSAGKRSYVLDGDNVRMGLNKNLGFSPEDRTENIRRIGEVAKLFSDAGVLTMSSFISPYRADRDDVRKLHEDDQLPFYEVYIDVPLEVAEERDPKGLYKKARAGEIKGFTGIDDPYEAPENAELHIRTDQLSIEESVRKVFDFLEGQGVLEA